MKSYILYIYTHKTPTATTLCGLIDSNKKKKDFISQIPFKLFYLHQLLLLTAAVAVAEAAASAHNYIEDYYSLFLGKEGGGSSLSQIVLSDQRHLSLLRASCRTLSISVLRVAIASSKPSPVRAHTGATAHTTPMASPKPRLTATHWAERACIWS